MKSVPAGQIGLSAEFREQAPFLAPIHHTQGYLPSMVQEHSLPTSVLQRVYWEPKEIIVLLPSYKWEPKTVNLGRNIALPSFVEADKAQVFVPHIL